MIDILHKTKVVPVECEGGKYLMVDISRCFDMIPKKYLKSHNYESSTKSAVKVQHHYMPSGTIPRDLAFCRWMACEKGVAMMPGSFFYPNKAKCMCDKYVRFTISCDVKTTQAAL